MPGNSAPKDRRQAQVVEYRMNGDDFETIGQKTGTSTVTAWRDWQDIKKKMEHDATIKHEVESLVAISFANSVNGAQVESRYIKDTGEKDEVTAQEAQVASQITERNQKRFSNLTGDNTNDKGGEISVVEQLMRGLQGNAGDNIIDIEQVDLTNEADIEEGIFFPPTDESALSGTMGLE